MPGQDRCISSMACVLLVTLRMFVGWHLMYEGLWKLDTQSTSQPWTAEGYLKNATGPLRPYFRELTGDPKDLNWLDYDTVTRRWDDWQARFVSHYPGVTEAGAGRRSVAEQLDLMLNGPKEFAVELDQLPTGLDLSKWQKAIRFDAAKKRLIVDGSYHLLPAERDAILALAIEPAADEGPETTKPVDPVHVKAAQQFRDAVNRLYALQSRLALKDRLAAILRGDPDRVGVLLKEKDGAIIEQRMGDLTRYQAMAARYEENFAKAKTAYQWDHLSRQWGELQQLRRSLVGPVQALEAELKTKATELLSPEQLAAGPVPEPMTQMRSINLQTMWGLTILGGLLIAGLATRLAAVGAAGLLMLFYLAAPPWPGTPPEQGIEHNFIVNKVLLESTTCLVFAALPTGRWFGVDALFAAWFRRRNSGS